MLNDKSIVIKFVETIYRVGLVNKVDREEIHYFVWVRYF